MKEENITDLTINDDLFITAKEHEEKLKRTGAARYCKKGLLNEIEIHPDAVIAYWRNRPIHCHHRNGKYFSKKQLIADGAYYDVDSSELIILPGYEHIEVHSNPPNIAEDILLNGHDFSPELSL